MLIQSSLCLDHWCGTERLVIATIWLTGALVTGCLSVNRKSSRHYVWSLGLAPGSKLEKKKLKKQGERKKILTQAVAGTFGSLMISWNAVSSDAGRSLPAST